MNKLWNVKVVYLMNLNERSQNLLRGYHAWDLCSDVFILSFYKINISAILILLIFIDHT